MDDRTVLGRVLLLLSAVSDGDDPVSLAELTRRTGLPKATARRIAEDLAVRGALTRSPDGYAVGSAIYTLSSRLTERRDVRVSATPRLAELQRRTNAPYVWMVDTSDPLQVSLIGALYARGLESAAGTWPRQVCDPAILTTALGRVLLAFRPETAEALLARGVPRITAATVTHPRLLHEQLDRAAQDGYALEHEQVRLGWSCLALPVRTQGGGGAVLGLVTPSHSLKARAMLEVLRDVADDNSWRLAHQPERRAHSLESARFRPGVSGADAVRSGQATTPSR
ncbi:IclR family transcriptional regulator [Ornithinimicrobium cryptoxanthini]|uniref:Helix-turn-helix domain-containing protein n=1 Tax=Ornithinimicrobium cryptoxanthini TaxID=2934161 RepID=A0ABY4YHD5_9MICO|nr:IclR family transcriptional regulator C-terminal domain-containing protein [Ornithinimicrobium cryptoxanthini]USQ75936.1 helix-turn-helix domain-containing protein [Ornithinimicrobium cryptoxanthini]